MSADDRSDRRYFAEIVRSKKRPEREKWRRRESNPRPRTHRTNVYERSPRLDLARRPEADALPAGQPILWLSSLRRLALLRLLARLLAPRPRPRAEPDGTSPDLVFARRRVRDRSFALAFCAGCFTRPTGDLGSLLDRRTDHVETWSPPYVVHRIAAHESASRARRPQFGAVGPSDVGGVAGTASEALSPRRARRHRRGCPSGSARGSAREHDREGEREADPRPSRLELVVLDHLHERRDGECDAEDRA